LVAFYKPFIQDRLLKIGGLFLLKKPENCDDALTIFLIDFYGKFYPKSIVYVTIDAIFRYKVLCLPIIPFR